MVDAYEGFCGKFTDYSLKYGKHLAHACETMDEFALSKTVEKIQDICQ